MENKQLEKNQIIEEIVQQTEQQTETGSDRLKRLGLTAVATKLSKAEKMKAAYENYLFLSAEKIDRFNKKLMNESLTENQRTRAYKRLQFIPLAKYTELPPPNVLEALEKAQNLNCFDTFEIAKIDWIREMKDPILFGVIEGCTDKFFISQWDDDVKVEDILFMD